MGSSSQTSTETPAISVLIPVRNGAAFLNEALESLAKQSFSDFEVVLIDNGSTDATPGLIAQWLQKDSRIRAFERPRLHLGQCLREAVELARAPLIARLDADDLAAPARFARQLEAMRCDTDLVMIGTAATLIDAHGGIAGTIRHPTSDRQLRSAMLTGCPFVHSSVLMRADACRAAGSYRAGLNICEDYDLWSRMIEHGRVANLPEVLTKYRVHQGSLTSRQPVRMALAAVCVLAAAHARTHGLPEPYSSGVPNLRRGLSLLEMSRGSARTLIRKRLIRHSLARAYIMLPLPARLKSVGRSAVQQLGPKRLYLRLLDRLFDARAVNVAPLEA